MPSKDWENFWNRVWSALWNTLGVVTVIVGFCWIGWWLFFSPPTPSGLNRPSRIEYVYLSTKEQQELQQAFRTLISTEKRPCATKSKGKEYSDVGSCSLFQLKLGMTVSEVQENIAMSGYFPNKPVPLEICKADKEGCVYTHHIHGMRDGLSVTANFSPKSSEDKSLFVKEITLWLGPGAHPYFEPESVRSSFIKAIGPPDNSGGAYDRWGENSHPHIYAFVHTYGRYSISLREK